MKVSRRHLMLGAGAATLAKLGSTTDPAAAADQPAPAEQSGAHSPASAAGAYRPVTTLNGRSLEYRLVGGVKEFRLVAEEVDHEFAPGSRAKCWGYNGSTPGPTIEAVEGDRVRIFVTNHLPEDTTVHWHGILLPSGMDGVGGLNQPHIRPGETYVYEFTLRQHGTHMYHPHADELVQMAVGMMGMFVIHPLEPEAEPIDRDFAVLLHNWALHPGTFRPDPSIMTDFDLWTMNSKVFPAIDSMVVRSGQRVRIRLGNLSMWNHPMHLHGHRFWVTGSDGGRWPRSIWRPEVTEVVAVGQTRDIEFVATPGDWAFHCHMAHHTMNAMGHGIPNPLGVDQSAVKEQLAALLPGYMSMGKDGMSEHAAHVQMDAMHGTTHMQGPQNTLPMMQGAGPFGNLEMGGMFTVLKVRDHVAADYRDPGWYPHPHGTVARRVSAEPMPKNMPKDMPMDMPMDPHS